MRETRGPTRRLTRGGRWLPIAAFAVVLGSGAAWAHADEAPSDEAGAGEAGAEGGEAGAEGAEHGHHEEGPPHVNWVDFSWSHKDAAGGTLDAGDQKMSPPYLFALFNFLFLLWLLGRTAWPKIKAFTRDRSVEIQDALDDAAKLRAEARAKLDECARRIANVDAEVDALVAEIRAQAEAEKRRILTEAAAQAALMKRDAEQRIVAETTRARAELEREVVTAAIAAAEIILRAKVGEPDQRTLVQSFITSLEATPPPAGEKEPS